TTGTSSRTTRTGGSNTTCATSSRRSGMRMRSVGSAATAHPSERARSSPDQEFALRPLRVLVSTSYYWPEGAGSAPYLTGLAEHLTAVGHDVVVASGFAHYPGWRAGAPGH